MTVSAAEIEILCKRYSGPSLFIDGKWRSAEGTTAYKVLNPATGEALAELPAASRADVRDAISAADAAFNEWRWTSASVRSNHLKAISGAILARRSELATCIALEIGKPLAQALGEVDNARASLEWYAAEVFRLQGHIIPPREIGSRTEIEYEPVGVAALMTPWNFPVGLLVRKLAPALAAGCTIVAKPAEEASLSAIIFFDILSDVDLPNGVANLVLGHPAEISNEIMKSNVVRKVSFTGSVSVGQSLAAQAAPTLKRLSLELGGNAPFIVFDDTDARSLGAAAAMRKVSNAGQVCVSPNRFYVQSGSLKSFVDSFVETARSVKLGGPFDETTQMGPLAVERRRDDVEAIVENAMNQGARCAVGGRRPAEYNHGFFFEPTLLTDVTDGMDILDTEIFGPVAPVVSFETEEEVLAQANNTNLGLAAYAFSGDLARAERMRAGLRVGMVGMNTMVLGRVEAPFGGINHSGYGREGGAFGMLEYVQTKWTESVIPSKPEQVKQ